MPQLHLKLCLIGLADVGPSVPLVLPLQNGAIPESMAAAAGIAGFTAGPDETLLLPSPANASPANAGSANSGRANNEVLLVGIGGTVVAEAAGARAAAALSTYHEIAIDGRGLPRAVAVSLVLGAARRCWHRPRYRQGPADADSPAMLIERISLVVDDPERVGARWREAVGLVEATVFARDLIAEPSNLLTPQAFVQQLAILAAAGVEIDVIPAERLSGEGLASARGGGSWLGQPAGPRGAALAGAAAVAAGGLRRQGRDLRYRRHLHQARGSDVGYARRHGGRCHLRGCHAGPRPPALTGAGDGRPRPGGKYDRRRRLSSRATSSAVITA